MSPAPSGRPGRFGSTRALTAGMEPGPAWSIPAPPTCRSQLTWMPIRPGPTRLAAPHRWVTWTPERRQRAATCLTGVHALVETRTLKSQSYLEPVGPVEGRRVCEPGRVRSEDRGRERGFEGVDIGDG